MGRYAVAGAQRCGGTPASLIEVRAMKKPTCPTCKRHAPPREGNAWFPFCAERCKAIDLGRWFGGAYAVPGAPVEAGTRESLEEGEPTGELH